MSPDNPLPRIAVVTGTNRGLGKAIVEMLCHNHFTVIATQRTPTSKLTTDEDAIHWKGVKVEYLDLSDVTSVNHFTDRVTTMLPYVDLLVNNAAMCPKSPPVKGKEVQWWHDTLTVNFRSQIHLTKGLCPLLQKSRRFPKVVNMSSGDGELVYFCDDLRKQLVELAYLDNTNDLIDKAEFLIQNIIGRPLDKLENEIIFGDQPAYKLSKALLNCFTQVIARESISSPNLSRIIFTSVCPGDVNTDMVDIDVEAISPAEAVSRMRSVIDVDVNNETGTFVRYGRKIAW